MVTRRTRSYKEKKPMTTFGQLILPLTVIMAMALLFFSVKLFFFDSYDVPAFQESQTNAEQAEKKIQEKDIPAAVKVTSSVKKTDTKQIALPVAHPVNNVKNNNAAIEKTKPEVTKSTEQVKTKPVVNESKKLQKQTVNSGSDLGWDIQIGAFSTKDYAVKLAEKASSNGYEAYISEIKRDGSMLYCVRVKNSKIDKEEAQKLSNKLLEQGYPVFLVEVKK